MTTNPYLIRLFPTASFLFGGETTFGEGLAANYLVRSETWPQQTTLLGMLRYQLLAHHGLLPLSVTNRAEAARRIGAASFAPGRANDFGEIGALSPVFLMRGHQPYRPTPRDSAYTKPPDSPLQHLLLKPDAAPGRVMMAGRIRDQIPTLARYNHKIPALPCLLDASGGQAIEQSAVFCRSQQVGIDTGADKQEPNDAFFKKETICFPSSDWAFAFVAQLSTALPGAFVTIGAEQSLFRMELTPLPDPRFSFDSFAACFGLSDSPGHERIEFLSDALVSASLYDHCWVAHTETVSFRSLLTTVANTRHYHNRPDKSHRFELIRRGSVLWSDQPEETLKAIDDPHFKKIGYNHVYVGAALPTV